MMKTVDIIILCVNIALTLSSFWGASKSLKYYKKSKNLSSHANLNKALNEIENMQKKLPEALSALGQSRRKQRGVNLEKIISSIGEELNRSYIAVHSYIPSEYSASFSETEKNANFELQKFINSCITGTLIKDESQFEIDYNMCQDRLNAMQEFLKDQIDKAGEKLK